MKISEILNLVPKNQRRVLDRVPDYDTVIGAGSVYKGEFRGGENFLVSGQVEGKCDLTGTLMLAESGRWIGDILADYVVVAGEVTGSVHARVKLEMRASARIHGSIRSPIIAMAEGATYEGDIHMLAAEVQTFNERRER